jgi:hypothetical protein
VTQPQGADIFFSSFHGWGNTGSGGKSFPSLDPRSPPADSWTSGSVQASAGGSESHSCHLQQCGCVPTYLLSIGENGKRVAWRPRGLLVKICPFPSPEWGFRSGRQGPKGLLMSGYGLLHIPHFMLIYIPKHS